MIPYELEEKLLYRKEQEEIRQDMREIEKTRLKTEITESIRTRAQEIRRWNKENADERKRGQYETVDFTPNGDIRVITRNLSVPTIPREITNMKNPRGKIYLRRSNPNESVFCLESNVEGQTIHVYFKGTEIGNGTYVLRKMSAKGISMYAQLPKAKKFAMEILQKLLREAPVYQVSDSPGWIKTGEDDFIFVGEDSITWEYLVEVVK